MHGLDYFCRINKITLTELCNHLGIKKSAPTGWKNGSRNFPKKYKLEIARLFQIPDEKLFLLEEKEIGELERAEIELIFNQACLNNAIEQGSSLVIPTFELNIKIIKRHIEMYNLLEKVKTNLRGSMINFASDDFDEKLNDIKSLIDKWK
ncbi:hypothetical protein [Rummeliibacillus suwonensis]|uniref:hypothetical protein n=1 Tax=Rummeliibacillus suwonensis TaxID=1306154 RepID=UPI0011B4D516|nr:hypothetical protein [Rummeliibacillus suwonensis]